MLYVEIRTPRDAFHFFGEVNGYNLQTLQQHVRQTTREDGVVHLRFEIQPPDQPAFDRYTRKWLPILAHSSVVVEVEVVESPARDRVRFLHPTEKAARVAADRPASSPARRTAAHRRVHASNAPRM